MINKLEKKLLNHNKFMANLNIIVEPSPPSSGDMLLRYSMADYLHWKPEVRTEVEDRICERFVYEIEKCIFDYELKNNIWNLIKPEYIIKTNFFNLFGAPIFRLIQFIWNCHCAHDDLDCYPQFEDKSWALLGNYETIYNFRNKLFDMFDYIDFDMEFYDFLAGKEIILDQVPLKLESCRYLPKNMLVFINGVDYEISLNLDKERVDYKVDYLLNYKGISKVSRCIEINTLFADSYSINQTVTEPLVGILEI